MLLMDNYGKLFKASEHPIHLLYLLLFPILVLLITLYDYYLYQGSNSLALFIIKPLPVCLMMASGFIYMFIYSLHCYAQQMTISLLMCLIGDVLLMFYSPPEFEFAEMIILGGVAFFVARICMSVTFLLHPYSFSKSGISIKENPYRFVLSGIFSLGYLAAATTILIREHLDVLMTILVFIYLLSMSFQLGCACLRVRGFKIETLTSQLLGLAGTILFTISDSLLLYDMFMAYGRFASPTWVMQILIDSGLSKIISITLYWLGMYLLTISMVRNSSYQIEKTGSENFQLADDF